MALSEINFPLTQLPRRDIVAILVSLGGVVALSWWYLFSMAADMAMPMSEGFEMTAMMSQQWDISYFAMMFLMWSIMMIGMMLPSVTPTVMIYSMVAKKAAKDGSQVASTGVFVSAYLVIWIGFSLLASFAQYLLDEASLLSSMMVSNNNFLGGSLLLLAGAYQFSPLKEQCLQHCRAPIEFISQYWKKGSWGAFQMGLQHGFYCLGCCWALMTLLFVGGVMNLLWIALLSLFVLLEKILPFAEKRGRITGSLMMVLGLVLIFSSNGIA